MLIGGRYVAEATRIAGAAWEELFTFGSATTDVIKTAARQIEASQRS